jgi:hypothetical protein
MAAYGMKGPYEGKKSGNYKIRQTPNYTPEQMRLHERGIEDIGEDSDLYRMAHGDQSFFEQMEAPQRQQFSTEIGALSSRFSGAGLGGRHSSGFQNTQTKAGMDFAQQLRANRQDLTRQARNDLFQMSQGLLSNEPYNTRLEKRGPEKEKWWSKALPYAGAAVGAVVGGPAGASAGYQIGNTARSFTNPQAQQGGGGESMNFMNNLPTSWGSGGKGGGVSPNTNGLDLAFRSGQIPYTG